jgi:hypothetical protein
LVGGGTFNFIDQNSPISQHCPNLSPIGPTASVFYGDSWMYVPAISNITGGSWKVVSNPGTFNSLLSYVQPNQTLYDRLNQFGARLYLGLAIDGIPLHPLFFEYDHT